MSNSHTAELCDCLYSNITCTYIALSSVPCLTVVLHSCVTIITVMEPAHTWHNYVTNVPAIPHSYTIITITISNVAAVNFLFQLPHHSSHYVRLMTVATQFCIPSARYLLTAEGAVWCWYRVWVLGVRTRTENVPRRAIGRELVDLAGECTKVRGEQQELLLYLLLLLLLLLLFNCNWVDIRWQ
jgi:hypothetical protein